MGGTEETDERADEGQQDVEDFYGLFHKANSF